MITLNVIDKNGKISHTDNNPHISTIKCIGNEAQTCLEKINKIKAIMSIHQF